MPYYSWASQSTAPSPAKHYVLLPKPEDASWQQLQQQMASEIADLSVWQHEMGVQYGLQLNDWLLLPDINATTHLYPAVDLTQINASDNVGDFAWRYQLSESQLRHLNQPLKTPEQLEDLRGQWVVVPMLSQQDKTTEASSPREEKLRQWMSGFWQGASEQGAGHAALDEASNLVTEAATSQVESWLNHTGGHARVKLNSGLQGRTNDIGVDYLHPLWSTEGDMLFTQLSAHRWNDRNIANIGFGWRHLLDDKIMVGSNLFYDRDLTRHHSRLGSGVELWSDRLRASANYYVPISGWRQSNDTHLTDAEYFNLAERAARGWDVNVDVALSDHFSVNAGWFQWYGDKVDVKGNRSEASKDPHGLDVAMKWQPIPLLSLQVEQEMISNQSDDTKVELDLSWQIGRTMNEMLDPDRAQAMPSLMQSNTAFVERNNNIVLAYKEEEKEWQIYFEPAAMTVKAGSAPFINTLKGANGGHIRYRSGNAELASVDNASGRITPLHAGEVTIFAELFASQGAKNPVSNASFQLTIMPADSAPSVTQVVIKGSAIIGEVLTGQYDYQANNGEAEGATEQRWFYSYAPDTILSESESYTVTEKDIGKKLVYQVTPVNLSHIRGEPVQQDIEGPSQHMDVLKLEPMGSGMVEANGDIKFPAGAKGSILFTATVKDAQGKPLTDRMVWWRHNNSQLGKLDNNQVRTDSAGMARVVFEDIESAGRDEITATLMDPAAGKTVKETAESEKTLAFNVSHAQLTLNLTTVDTQQPVIVGSGKIKLQAQLHETDSLGISGQTLAWSSDNQPAGSTTTNENGVAQAELVAPTDYGDGQWRVTVALAGQVEKTLTLALQKQDTTQLSAEPLSVTHGTESKTLSISGGNGGTKHFSSSQADVVAVNASSGAMTFGKVGKATITVSQQATGTHAAPANLSVEVTVTRQQPDALQSNLTEVTGVIGTPQSLGISGGNGGAVHFGSSDARVVTVDARGGMVFHQQGNATITVSQDATDTVAAPARLEIAIKVDKKRPEVLSSGSISGQVGVAGEALSVSGGIPGAAKIYLSADPDIVTVTENGGVPTFKKAGTTHINVSQNSTDEYNAPATLQLQVTVTQPTPPLQTDSTTLEGRLDITHDLKISGGNGTGNISFTSSDSAIVSVEQKDSTSATLKYLKAGVATITVSQKSTSTHPAPNDLLVVVTVHKLIADILYANPDSVTGTVGGTTVLRIDGGNSINNEGGEISFSSTNPDVVSVVKDGNNGNLTFHKVGTASIKVNQSETETHRQPQELSVEVRVSQNQSVSARFVVTRSRTGKVSEIPVSPGYFNFFTEMDIRAENETTNVALSNVKVCLRKNNVTLDCKTTDANGNAYNFYVEEVMNYYPSYPSNTVNFYVDGD